MVQQFEEEKGKSISNYLPALTTLQPCQLIELINISWPPRSLAAAAASSRVSWLLIELAGIISPHLLSVTSGLLSFAEVVQGLSDKPSRAGGGWGRGSVCSGEGWYLVSSQQVGKEVHAHGPHPCVSLM